MKRVVHIITSLNDGGAEALLYRICTSPHPPLEHIVISLTDMGKYGPLLKRDDIITFSLEIRSFFTLFQGFFKLLKLLNSIKPYSVQTWLYHADFLGGICAKLSGVPHIFWGVHNTKLNWKHSSLSSLILVRLLSVLSYFIPEKIFFCAKSAQQVHANLGYCPHKLITIYNGYDVDYFKPDIVSRKRERLLYHIAETTFFIGMVARFSPQKDHDTFLKALLHLRRENLTFRCIIVGHNVTQLKEQIRMYGLEEYVILQESRMDIKNIFNAIDVLVLSSEYGEAFPNVIAEAMSCGTPCIATDVGDVQFMIGESGIVVPIKKPSALAAALLSLNRKKQSLEEWEKLKKLARQRVSNNFNFCSMLKKYLSWWSGKNL